ncbi:MYG1 protein [Spironucleus salmonicida]|uniref:MYG1 protein n=1 Tax=Spironucleus salmonicida TaxID=348837 RepID=V6LFF4_9EUKA|nr:MYG1 protein [Spironucleus salmonicida]KAH0571142.1 MYG1 protein [Spironucleus salmonicida]|eukprot:EST43268.1 Metal-dependent protein hydrolase [Spironucleus salmonicida]
MQMRICTHDGAYHADDVIAACFLQKIYTNVEIVRTRDQSVIDQADVVFDVGGVYNKSTLRFDHHQLSFTDCIGEIPLSSAGLIFRDLGLQLCENGTHHQIIYQRFIKFIDMHDNGIDGGRAEFSLQIAKLGAIGKTFEQAIEFAMQVLDLEIQFAKMLISSKIEVEKAISQQSGIFLHLDSTVMWIEVLYDIPGNEKFMFVTTQKNGQYRINTINISDSSFRSRQKLPQQWAGYRDSELDDITGVTGGVFVHKGAFVGIWKTKEALDQIKYILESKQKE